MKITLTGLDEKTDRNYLRDIFVKMNHFDRKRIELAILLSDKPEGRNRYPDLFTVEDIIYYLASGGISLAIHICGKSALDKAIKGEYKGILHFANRIQLNGKISPEYLTEFANGCPAQEIITQHVPYNSELLNLPIRNHSLLIDASGGRGISPTEWTCPKSTVFWYPKNIGFAGGLGIHNLKAELPKIISVAHASKDCWVDMETSLRDENDWFDINKALEAIRIVLNDY